MDVNLILSGVLAVSTVCYTVINLMMWFESRATRKQKTAPCVIAYLKFTDNHNTLCVHFKNIGEGCATCVRARMIKDYNQFNKADLPLSKWAIFNGGVNIFPPQYELKYYIDSACDIDYKAEDSFIEFELEYRDIQGKGLKQDVFKLPFNQVGNNYSNPPETYLGQIPYYLKELNGTIKNTLSQKPFNSK